MSNFFIIREHLCVKYLVIYSGGNWKAYSVFYDAYMYLYLFQITLSPVLLIRQYSFGTTCIYLLNNYNNSSCMPAYIMCQLIIYSYNAQLIRQATEISTKVFDTLSCKNFNRKLANSQKRKENILVNLV